MILHQRPISPGRLLCHRNTVVCILFVLSLISCSDKEESTPAWDIVIGRYEGLLYISKPLEPNHEAEPFPNQKVQVTKVRSDTYRLSSSNPNIPTFEFRYDHGLTSSAGVIYNEYYFVVNAQTNNGVSVQASHVVFDRDRPEIDFSIFNGNGDTLWLYGGQKK